MTLTVHDVSIRHYTEADIDSIVAMINGDPFHLKNEVTVQAFKHGLDEPGERIRDNTFVVEREHAIVGYFSLCFVEANTRINVYCYGTVDRSWRRRGIGTAIFAFIFDHLKAIAQQEARTIRFIHRADTRIAGETTLGTNFGMQEKNIMEVRCRRDIELSQAYNLPPGYKFRPPVLADANDWADVYNDAFDGHKQAESVIHEFKGTDFSPNLYILCNDKAGQAVGLLCATQSGTQARIASIAVRRDAQGLGIGKALLSEIINRLHGVGVRDIRLSVDSQKTAAKSLYSKFGFQEEYQRINYVTTFLP
ncbi:GNAT family N-acetyltransferase [Alicyclobacillus fodiniaquatilis]|uniref:GNAT family N-acetyltransferase n=1 Tax=Alicyclobacillus fodiniaquatilis TaxID=1661150 RepID=A0ABW4JRM2_9BACL